MNVAALDEAVCRFPRILAECARYHCDTVRLLFLRSEPQTIQAIIREYHLIVGRPA